MEKPTKPHPKPVFGKRKAAYTTTKSNIKSNPKSKMKRFGKFFLIYPLLMSREIRRIRWDKGWALNKKFWLTIGFITAFGIFFVIVQTILQIVLEASKVLV